MLCLTYIMLENAAWKPNRYCCHPFGFLAISIPQYTEYTKVLF